MPWCHQCEEEYRVGFTTCATCGAPLKEDPPEKFVPAYDPPALLATAPTTMEAYRMEALLRPAGIPVRKGSVSPAGSYNTLLGAQPLYTENVELWVPSSHLEQARELLEPLMISGEDEPARDWEEQSPQQPEEELSQELRELVEDWQDTETPLTGEAPPKPPRNPLTPTDTYLLRRKIMKWVILANVVAFALLVLVSACSGVFFLPGTFYM